MKIKLSLIFWGLLVSCAAVADHCEKHFGTEVSEFLRVSQNQEDNHNNHNNRFDNIALKLEQSFGNLEPADIVPTHLVFKEINELSIDHRSNVWSGPLNLGPQKKQGKYASTSFII